MRNSDDGTRSVSGIGTPPAPPPIPSASKINAVFASALDAVHHNVEMVGRLPARLKLWVTEMAAYGAADLNFTWLEALVNVLFETVLLLRIPAIDIMTPYCLVCGDPIVRTPSL